jgi:hypothetical protein
MTAASAPYLFGDLGFLAPNLIRDSKDGSGFDHVDLLDVD